MYIHNSRKNALLAKKGDETAKKNIATEKKLNETIIQHKG
jgi:hypothetical protein